MNTSKTYKISEELYKAILESVYHNGRYSGNLDESVKPSHFDSAIKHAINMVEEQQYIYEFDAEKQAFDNLATHNERFSNYGEDD